MFWMKTNDVYFRTFKYGFQYLKYNSVIWHIPFQNFDIASDTLISLKSLCVCVHVRMSLYRGKAAILVVRNSLSLPKVRATQNRMWEVRSSTHLCRPAARCPRTAERVNVYSSLSQSETLEGNVILSQQSEMSHNAAFFNAQVNALLC